MLIMHQFSLVGSKLLVKCPAIDLESIRGGDFESLCRLAHMAN